MVHEQRFTPVAQLALLLALCGAGIIVSAILTGAIGNVVLHVKIENLASEILKPENVQVARLIQIITSFFIFPLPALIVAGLNGGSATHNLGFNEAISRSQILLVVFILIAGTMISGALAEVNQLIPIPKSAATYFRSLEDNYNKEVLAMSNLKSTFDLVMSLLVLALLPAIFEEMLFRGCLQKIIVSITRSAFGGIFITSIIFSAVHFSYYGFLPRLFLGLMLGYIFYYSKSIWLSILAHFLNNAYAVIGMYMLSRSGQLSTDALEETFPWYYGLIGAAIFILVLIQFKKESAKVIARYQHVPANELNNIIEDNVE